MDSILPFIATVIVDYLLFASVIAITLVVIAWCIIRLGGIRGPAHRYIIWLFTLIGISAAPGVWLHGPRLTLSVPPDQHHFVEVLTQKTDFRSKVTPVAEKFLETLPIKLSVNISTSSTVSSSQATLISVPCGFQWIKTLFFWGWGVGFLFMNIRLFAGWYRLIRMVRSAEPPPEDLCLERGLAGRIELLLTTQMGSPVCFGLLKPIILLPEKMVDNITREDLRMVLRHELAHIERKDCWVNLFQRLVEALLFFHPFVWYASFQLTHQREQLCDNHVIAGNVSPANYVQLLTRIVEQAFEKRSYQALALFEGRLLARVRPLLDSGNKKQVKATRPAIMAGVFAVAMLMAFGTIRLEARTDPGETANPLKLNQDKALFRLSQKQEFTETAAVVQNFSPSEPESTGDRIVSKPTPTGVELGVAAVLPVEEENTGPGPAQTENVMDPSRDIENDVIPRSEMADSDGMDSQLIDSEIPVNMDETKNRQSINLASLPIDMEIIPVEPENDYSAGTEIERPIIKGIEEKKSNMPQTEMRREIENENVRIPMGARIFDWRVIDNRNIIIMTRFYGSFKATLAKDCPELSKYRNRKNLRFDSNWPYELDVSSSVILPNDDAYEIHKLVPYKTKNMDYINIF